jgi:hypothetical protein
MVVAGDELREVREVHVDYAEAFRDTGINALLA